MKSLILFMLFANQAFDQIMSLMGFNGFGLIKVVHANRRRQRQQHFGGGFGGDEEFFQ